MYDYLFVLVPRHLPYLLQGALITLQLSILSMSFGIALGLAAALGRLSRRWWIDIPLRILVEIIRDVPLIVQLLVIYFTLPHLGIRLPGFWAGILGLSLNMAAYLSEVFRAAILSIDDGQREAGVSMGMHPAMIYRRVILPQAFRIAIPTVGGYFISLLKDSSLVSFIAVNELLRHGSIIINNTFLSMEIYLMVAGVYFFMSFVASRLVILLELALTPKHRRIGFFGRVDA